MPLMKKSSATQGTGRAGTEQRPSHLSMQHSCSFLIMSPCIIYANYRRVHQKCCGIIFPIYLFTWWFRKVATLILKHYIKLRDHISRRRMEDTWEKKLIKQCFNANVCHLSIYISVVRLSVLISVSKQMWEFSTGPLKFSNRWGHRLACDWLVWIPVCYQAFPSWVQMERI